MYIPRTLLLRLILELIEFLVSLGLGLVPRRVGPVRFLSDDSQPDAPSYLGRSSRGVPLLPSFCPCFPCLLFFFLPSPVPAHRFCGLGFSFPLPLPLPLLLLPPMLPRSLAQPPLPLPRSRSRCSRRSHSRPRCHRCRCRCRCGCHCGRCRNTRQLTQAPCTTRARTHLLSRLTTYAQRTRAHFTPQHWLSVSYGIVLVRVRVRRPS